MLTFFTLLLLTEHAWIIHRNSSNLIFRYWDVFKHENTVCSLHFYKRRPKSGQARNTLKIYFADYAGFWRTWFKVFIKLLLWQICLEVRVGLGKVWVQIFLIISIIILSFSLLYPDTIKTIHTSTSWGGGEIRPNFRIMQILFLYSAQL